MSQAADSDDPKWSPIKLSDSAKRRIAKMLGFDLAKSEIEARVTAEDKRWGGFDRADVEVTVRSGRETMEINWGYLRGAMGVQECYGQTHTISHHSRHAPEPLLTVSVACDDMHPWMEWDFGGTLGPIATWQANSRFTEAQWKALFNKKMYVLNPKSSDDRSERIPAYLKDHFTISQSKTYQPRPDWVVETSKVAKIALGSTTEKYRAVERPRFGTQKAWRETLAA